ncbi:sialate:O-sulfotransferase 2-like [Clavelina lepadiformis]|uniref:sialate:O-sulfotransferase 2-like n=1 Tax=Clavelina lepadiformis TaxID=159417 RepID=UPI004040FE32
MFKLPPDFFKTAILAPAASQSQVTPVWCYLYCERKEQTLSMVTAANECHCGHTTDHFPGAGNTWMRYLIEIATGVFTGSIYYDDILAAGGFLGELDDISSGRTLVIKSHRAMSNSSKSIVLIRNPFHTIVAEFTRKSYNESHTWLGSAAIFHSSKWNRKVSKMASKWLQKNLVYLASSRPLVVYYEDLKQDHVKQMRRVVDFIGFKVTNLEERLLCLQLESTGLFKRSPRKDGFNPYSRDQTELINEYVARLKNYMKENVTSAPPLPNYEREL